MKINKKTIELVTQKITGLSKLELFLKKNIQKKFKPKIDEALYRLKKWEPLEYIINSAEFYSLDFFVDKRVLVPRNETEIIVDKILKHISQKLSLTTSKKNIKQNKKIILVDIWTWSWCIPISIIKNISKNNLLKKCYISDISKKALEVLRINIKKHWLNEVIIPLEWNLLDSIIPIFDKNEEFVYITANLPYIKQNDFENMDDSVIWFEPDIALYWWKKTGFELYEKLIRQCVFFKKEKNINTLVLFIEIWFDQYNISKDFLQKNNLKFEYYQDKNWFYRCVKVEI